MLIDVLNPQDDARNLGPLWVRRSQTAWISRRAAVFRYELSLTKPRGCSGEGKGGRRGYGRALVRPATGEERAGRPTALTAACGRVSFVVFRTHSWRRGCELRAAIGPVAAGVIIDTTAMAGIDAMDIRRVYACPPQCKRPTGRTVLERGLGEERNRNHIPRGDMVPRCSSQRAFHRDANDRRVRSMVGAVTGSLHAYSVGFDACAPAELSSALE